MIRVIIIRTGSTERWLSGCNYIFIVSKLLERAAVSLRVGSWADKGQV